MNESQISNSEKATGLRVLAEPIGQRESGNPYLWLLYDGIRNRGAKVSSFTFWKSIFSSYDVLHFHWPDRILRSNNFIEAILRHGRMTLVQIFARMRGAKVVWTCHNLENHDGDIRLSKWFFRKLFLRLITHVIVLSPSSVRRLIEVYPSVSSKHCKVVPHGHYKSLYTKKTKRSDARIKLGIPVDSIVFLTFGLIRAYKQVPELIRCFKEIENERWRLIIAGEPDSVEIRDTILKSSNGDDRIVLKLESIEERDIPDLFASSNIVVCNFRNILNSGSVLLSLSLNRPVLAPMRGGLLDIRNNVGEGWLRLFDGNITKQLLLDMAHSSALISEDDAPDLDSYDWEAISKSTYEFFGGIDL